MPIDKTRLQQALLEKLQNELDLITRAALMAREEATHDESKATSKYETHGQEAAYLAEGQARFASELQDSIALYKTLSFPDFTDGSTVGIGALVTLESRGRSTLYLLGPRNGGLDIALDGQTITLITPQSPLGAQLVNARVGTTVHLPGRTTPQPHRVAAIA